MLCNFVIKISEGFWQFLIVCCGCSRKMQRIIDTAIQLVSVVDNLGKIWCRFLRIVRRSGVAFMKKATPILQQIYRGRAVFGLKTVGPSSALQ